MQPQLCVPRQLRRKHYSMQIGIWPQTIKNIAITTFLLSVFFLGQPVAAAGTCECKVEVSGPDQSCLFPSIDPKNGQPTQDNLLTFTEKKEINFRTLVKIPEIGTACVTGATASLFLDDKTDPTLVLSKSVCKSGTIDGTAGNESQFIYQLSECKYTAAPSSGGSSGGGAAGAADPAAGAPVAGAAESPVGAAAKNVDVFDSGNPDCNKVCQWIVENYSRPDYKGPIPPCAFTGQCRDVNVLVDFFIRQGKMLMGLIGMLGLVAFIYGGILMVFSFGSADKVGQGKEVMIAAVIGIIIVFSAYLAVAFLLKTVGVNPDLQAIK